MEQKINNILNNKIKKQMANAQEYIDMLHIKKKDDDVKQKVTVDDLLKQE